MDSAKLERILEMTQELLRLGQEGEWDDLVALEEERRPLIYDVFSNPPAPADRERVQAAIRTILATDQTVLELSTARRQEVGGVLRTLGKGKTAARAYAQNSR